jgi:hypothetical protein
VTESQYTKNKPKEGYREISNAIFRILAVFVAVSVMQALAGALVALLLPPLLPPKEPLLMPNPYSPDVVRWAHSCETTSSNFMFAALVAWLWGQPKLVHSKALAQAA